MPRPSKGPRLYWWKKKGTAAGQWFIRDGKRMRATGCGEGEREAAEEALAEYLSTKQGRPDGRVRRADQVLIADVVSLYSRTVACDHARPHETGARLERILDHFGEMTVAGVNGEECRDYTKKRGSLSAARRELQDLSAAIQNAHKEGLFAEAIRVWKPDAGDIREQWLDRDQFARLLWVAWRFRETQKGKKTKKASRQHIARFALVAAYTGSRSAKICEASFTPEEGRGWVDLKSGVFYRSASGARRTNKRARPIRLPDRVLAHMRRWQRLGQKYVVEFNGRPVSTVKRAFPRVVVDAGLPADITAHALRHTAATWLMKNKAHPIDAARYIDMSLEMYERRYAHHHPDFTSSAGAAVTARPGRNNNVTETSGQKRNEPERKRAK